MTTDGVQTLVFTEHMVNAMDNMDIVDATTVVPFLVQRLEEHDQDYGSAFCFRPKWGALGT